MTDRGDVDVSDGPEAGAAYPPPLHVLRDLGLEVEVLDGGITRGRLAARASSGTEDAVAMPFGVVATAVDILAGAVCGRVIAPDWMATSVMSLHLGPLDATLEVVLDAAVLRAGRSTVTVEVDVTQDEPGGSAVLTFSRLPRRATTLVLPDAGGAPGDRYGFGDLDAASGRIGIGVDGFDAAIGCRAVDGDRTRLEAEISPYVRNSFGAVNGGVVAAVADAAARAAVDRPGWRTVDLSTSFLGQGRVGPMSATTRTVRRDDGSCTVRVELTDAGQLDDAGAPRLMSVSHVVLGPGVDGSGGVRV